MAAVVSVNVTVALIGVAMVLGGQIPLVALFSVTLGGEPFVCFLNER